MGIIKREDIAGVSVDGRIICLDCLSDEEFFAAKEDDMILLEDVNNSDDDLYFCDDCHKRLS